MKKIMCLALAALMLLAGCAVAEQGALPGLNRFTAVTLDGGEFTEADLAEADLTVVNIWSTTCPPCIEEMPALGAFGKALPENVRLVAICLDAYLAQDEVKAFLEESGFEETTLIGGDGDLTTLVSQLMYTPTTLFLDSEGNPAAEPLIGSPADVEGTYLACVNAALAALGKPEIALAQGDA